MTRVSALRLVVSTLIALTLFAPPGQFLPRGGHIAWADPIVRGAVPASGPPGTRVTLADDQPDLFIGKPFSVILGSDTLAIGETDGHGGFSVQVQVPDTTPTGPAVFLVQTSSQTIEFPFQVTAVAVTPSNTSTPVVAPSFTPTQPPPTSTQPSPTATASPSATMPAVATPSATPLPGRVALTISPDSGPPGLANVLVSAPPGSWTATLEDNFWICSAAGNCLPIFPERVASSGIWRVSIPQQLAGGAATIALSRGSPDAPALWGAFTVTPMLRLATSAAVLGGTLAVTGDGFLPYVGVDFFLGGVHLNVTPADRSDTLAGSPTSVQPNSVGHLEVVVSIPAVLATPGTSNLSAVIGDQTASVALTILAPATVTPTPSLSVTDTRTATRTASATHTASPTRTVTGTRTASPTRTVTGTRTASPTGTVTRTRTVSPTGTPTAAGTVAGNAPHVTGTPPVVVGTVLALPPAGATTTAVTSTSILFAEGYTGASDKTDPVSYMETLFVLNPSTSPAAVTFTYYVTGRNSPIMVHRTVAAQSTLRENVNADVGRGCEVASVVTSSRRIVVSRAILRSAGSGPRLDGSMASGASRPGKKWYFAEGYTGSSFQEYLVLFNVSATAAHVRVQLIPDAAATSVLPVVSRVVAARGRLTLNLRSLNQGNHTPSIGMIVTSDVPITAERVEYFGDGAGSSKFGAIATQGMASPTTQAAFAFGSSGGLAYGSTQLAGDQDFITVLNPSDSLGSIRLSVVFRDAAGTIVGTPVTVSVASGTRRTISANSHLGSRATRPFSVSIQGTGPFVAESMQYFGGSPNQGSHPGIAIPASIARSRDVLFAALAPSPAGSTSLHRSIVVHNRSSARTAFRVGYMGSHGPGPTAVHAVPAGGIVTIDVDAETRGMRNADTLGATLSVLPGETGDVVAVAVLTAADGSAALEDGSGQS